MKIILALIVLIFNAISWADSKDCTEYYKKGGFFNFYRQFFEPNACYLSVSPQDTSSMIFRSYLTTQNGLFMVFNSYGEGEGPEMTGARDYYFFPRTQIPDSSLKDEILKIQTANSLAAVNFNIETGMIHSVDGGNVTVKDEILPTNNGGVEITSFNGLMLDVGFALGHDPVSEKNRTVFFQDHTGARCYLKNSEIFIYTSQDAELPDDETIKNLLAKKCRQLKLLF